MSLYRHQHEATGLAHDEALQPDGKRVEAPLELPAESIFFNMLGGADQRVELPVDLMKRPVVGPVVEPLAEIARPLQGSLPLGPVSKTQGAQRRGIVDTQVTFGEAMQEGNTTVTFSPDASIRKDIHGNAAGFQHPRDLAQSEIHIRHVFEDLIAEHEVERSGFEGDGRLHTTDERLKGRGNVRGIVPAFVEYITTPGVDVSLPERTDDLARPTAVIQYSSRLTPADPIGEKFTGMHPSVSTP